ncbi:MAG: hypothetical protein ACFFBF_16725, partial [Promethearchaeota archaeon]
GLRVEVFSRFNGIRYKNIFYYHDIPIFFCFTLNVHQKLVFKNFLFSHDKIEFEDKIYLNYIFQKFETNLIISEI